jgi:hypothetical protein
MSKSPTALATSVLLLLANSLFAGDDGIKKSSSDPPKNEGIELKDGDTFIACFWSSRDSRGKHRPVSHPAGNAAKKEAEDLKLPWQGMNVAKEDEQYQFLNFVGAERLPDPFANKVILMRFFHREGTGAVPAAEYISLAPDENVLSVKKKFLEYLERTAIPPPVGTKVSSVEWKPEPTTRAVSDTSGRQVATTVSASDPKVATANK